MVGWAGWFLKALINTFQKPVDGYTEYCLCMEPAWGSVVGHLRRVGMIESVLDSLEIGEGEVE